uniref:C2H2-type domain-containing protein n=1 Tax=Scylla olivacea TaxID=85551 RepID=A0A0P4VVK1_SCYOL
MVVLVVVVAMVEEEGRRVLMEGWCVAGAAAGQQRCPLCHKSLSRWTSLRRHIEDKHTQGGIHVCPICFHVYRTKNSLHNHLSVYHRGATGSRGRRGRYPSYTVLRPATAHQLAELKAAARRISMPPAAPDLPSPVPVSAPVSAPLPAPAPVPAPALAPALPEELGVAGHSTAGGFEALLQGDAEMAGGALLPSPCKSSTASPTGLASPQGVDE